MKKIFSTLFVAATMLSACTNDNILDVASYGYLSLGLTTDNTVTTRAVQSVSNFSTWTVKVGDTNYTGPSQKFAAGRYTVTASNYADLATANAANENWGDAYYSGSTSVTLAAGETKNVTVACGTAMNARLAVSFSLNAAITNCTLTAKKGDNDLVFSASNASTAKAYYNAGSIVNYSVSYTYRGATKTLTGKSVTLGTAATEKKINITANDNGTITISVSYDDTFGDGGSDTITIDAATGSEVV